MKDSIKHVPLQSVPTTYNVCTPMLEPNVITNLSKREREKIWKPIEEEEGE